MADDIKRYCPATDPPALCERGCGMGACVIDKIYRAHDGAFSKHEIELGLRQFENAVARDRSGYIDALMKQIDEGVGEWGCPQTGTAGRHTSRYYDEGEPCAQCGAVPPPDEDEPSPFWKSVRELAAMREHIPEERRAGSLVRQFFATAVKEKSDAD